jgi:hypothetical protein
MTRWLAVTAVALGLIAAAAIGRAQPVSPAKPNFSGVWILNRSLSDKPSQVDVGASVSGQRWDAASDTGYRGQRSGPAAGMRDRRSAIDRLVNELRNPSPSLTISHAGSTLTVTNTEDRTRLFQTNGQKDPHQVGDTTVLSSSRWDGERLVTEYDLGSGRTIRIVQSIIPDTRQLLEQVSFSNGQTIKRVYDPARPTKRP